MRNLVGHIVVKAGLGAVFTIITTAMKVCQFFQSMWTNMRCNTD